ncbi:MAG: PC4/YdbC family ssDNA-binding protein [Anaerolineae bacterium]|nr:PC4/YdbC family ssDNA-binding protein [Anaerolineae bacterium]
MADIKYEIVQKIGVLSTSASGWAKELNLVSWNDRDPKYDLRDWSSENKQMGKGVTLSREELKALRDLLIGIEL